MEGRFNSISSSIQITKDISNKKEVPKSNNMKQKLYESIVRTSMKNNNIDEDLWWKNSKNISDLTKDWPTYDPPPTEIQHDVANKFVESLKIQKWFDSD